MEPISAHISFEEATKSQTAIRHGIDNTPPPEAIERMKAVANACFEPIREWYGKPLRVSSFYRCDALNKKIGGARTSQHLAGEAIDVDSGSRSENKKILEWAKANLVYDQLLSEYPNEEGPSWVHISFRVGNNRNMFLVIR